MLIQVARDLNVEFEKKLKYEQNAQYGHFLRLTRAVGTCMGCSSNDKFLQLSYRTRVVFVARKSTLNSLPKKQASFLQPP
jgi:hypothetical protein